jgi:hypothetical protein
VTADQNAPAIALLRQLLALQAAGIPVRLSTVVDRTVSARGLLLSTQNRLAYQRRAEQLIADGLIVTAPTVELDPGDLYAALSPQGAATLTATGQHAPLPTSGPVSPATSSLYT